MKKLLLMVGVIVIAGCALESGSWLVLNAPEKSDVIVVLAGDHNDERFWRGMQLLRAGYAQQLFLDARADTLQYGHSPAEYAAAFIQQAGGDMRNRVHVCPLRGNSTAAESQCTRACLAPLHPHSVLLVTSDHHTRRALSVEQHIMPEYHWSVAAATNDFEFGKQWWRRREWAKMYVEEWQRFAWWELVDRWRT
jgi:uncharacterized SAM-binding protein YcdF (DUF218 family)